MSVQSPNLTGFIGGQGGANALQDVLRIATRRIRMLRLLRSGSVALCYGALACLILVGLGKVSHGLAPAPGLLAGLMALALILGALHALLPRLTDLDVARLTESRADLKERLSSAVEFRRLGMEPTAPFYGEQFSDANRHAAELDIKKLYPARIPRTLPLGIILCLALWGVYFLPGLPIFWSKEKKAEMAEVKAQGIQLLKVAEDKEKTADQQKLDETKKAAAEARKLAEAMKHGKMEKKEALVAMQKLTKKMEDQQRKLAEKQAPKSLDQAGKEFKKSMDQMQKDVERARKDRQAQEAQKQMAVRDMKQALDKAKQNQQQSEAMKQATKAMEQMSQAMANQSPQQMQKAMEQMAKAMQSGNMSKQEMQQMAQMMQAMAQALQNTQMNQASQQMAQMAQMMQAMQSMDAKSMQQLAQMMQKIGAMCKNPGNGMPLLDAKELAALLQALKDGRMTMCMGKKPGNGGGGAGMGINGYGGKDKAMKDIDKTNPRLMVNNEKRYSKAAGKSGSVQELMKYMAMSSPAPKHLPNAKVNGQRTQQGQELSTQMTGDPEPTHSNAPYYQAVETSRRQAESTLDKENIPASMKKQVRDYFDSIKP
jgi:myosin heavy subunit